MPAPSKGHGGQVGPPVMSRFVELDPMDWYTSAACRELYWEGVDFFPNMDDLEAVEVAKGICRGCGVLEECKAWVMREKNKQEFGIWGGMTPWERGVR